MIRVKIRNRADREHLLLYYVDPATGKEKHRSAGTRDPDAAQRAAGAWEQELLAFRGAFGDGWEYFVHRFSDEHLATLAKNSRSGYLTALALFQRLTGSQRLADVTTGAVSTFQERLLREGRPLTTIAKHLTHLRTALRWAEYVGLVRAAPRIKLPKVPKRTLMRGRPLGAEEFRQLLAAADEVAGDDAAELKRLIELLWHSGLRLTEALALDWQHPPVTLALDSHPPQLIFYAEGQKSRRDESVPMTPELAAWFARTPKERRRGRVIRLHGDRFSVGKLISGCGTAAGITVNAAGKPASAHDLRRSFGTRLAPRVRPLTLQKLMRHATLETTLRYYVSLSSADASEELWRDEQRPASGPKPARAVPRKVPKKNVRTGKRRSAK